MNVLKPFENESPSPISRRFFAFFIDALLIVAAHFVLFLISGSITSNTSSYKQEETVLKSTRIRCLEIEEEAHIYEFEGSGEERFNSPIDSEELFKQWAYSHILKSYNSNQAYFVTQGINEFELGSDVVEASYQTDRLAYFFANFIEQKNSDYSIIDLGGKTAKEYYYSFFQQEAFYYSNGDQIEHLWIYDSLTYELPTLKDSFAANLYKYFKGDSSNQMNISTYNLLAKTYQNIFDKEVEILTNSKEFLNSYNAYYESYSTLAKYINISNICSYLVAFLATYVLPIIISENHVSLGKKIIKVQTVDIEGYPLVPYQLTLRTICKFFTFFGCTLASSFIVTGKNSSWVFPLFSIGNINVSILSLNILMLFAALASFVISNFVNKKRDISDLISHSYLIDMRYYTPHKEGNYLVEEVDKKEKDRTDPINEVEVVDSSTIKK